jgi:hypothetical protein
LRPRDQWYLGGMDNTQQHSYFTGNWKIRISESGAREAIRESQSLSRSRYVCIYISWPTALLVLWSL